jgi:heterodisulfide reductase subunit D
MVKEEKELRKIPIDNLSFRELLELDACTRCGECGNWCPVYDQDPKEGLTPGKKILDLKKIITSQHSLRGKLLQSNIDPKLKKFLSFILGYQEVDKEVIDNFVKNLYECSTCGQCHIVCPSNINTVPLWEDIRKSFVRAGYGPLEPQKALIQSVKAFDNPWQQPRVGRTKWAKWAKKENLITELPKEIKKNKAKILLFLGCTAAYDINVNKIAISTVNILEKLGIKYGWLGKDEKCCGSVLLRIGDTEFERIANDNIKTFNSLGIHTLITSCAGCFKTIKQDYPLVGKLNFEVLSTAQFLCRLQEEKKLPLVLPVEKRVTYHDPCHLGRANQVYDEPREVLKAIPGLELVEMERNYQYSRCCGAGGGLKSGYPDIQSKMAQARVREAERTGAQELVSACPFCYQGLKVGIEELNSSLKMRDITELVAMSLEK